MQEGRVKVHTGNKREIYPLRDAVSALCHQLIRLCLLKGQLEKPTGQADIQGELGEFAVKLYSKLIEKLSVPNVRGV